MNTSTGIREDTQQFTDDRIIVRGETGTFTVACTDEGEGPPVVLLHCNASSRHQWRPLIGALSGRFRVLAVDLFGHGDSQLPHPPRTFTVADEVAMVAAMINRAGEPVHLVGHSYGGAIALKAALALKPDVRSLTVIEPAVFELLRHAGDGQSWGEIHALARGHLERMHRDAPQAAAEWFMGYWIGAAAWEATPEKRRAVICDTMGAVANAWEIILSEPTGLGEYAGLDLPTLLIQGGATQAPCRGVVALLGRTLPHSATVVIPKAGHMAPITHAEPVNQAIATHLDCATRVTTAASRRQPQAAGRAAERRVAAPMAALAMQPA